jgi:hypothetical protein
MTLELVHIQQQYTRQEIVQPYLQTVDQAALRYKETPTISQSLEAIFPEQKQADKRIKLTKEALGSLAAQYNETELSDVITEVEYLTESWLDEYERKIFDGLTLQELLHEKGAK